MESRAARLTGRRGAALVRELGEHVGFIAADVTREEQLNALIDESGAWHGRLDVLFNNAGETHWRSARR